MKASPSETNIHTSIITSMGLDNAQAIVHALEQVNSFTLPWMPDSAEWKEAVILWAEQEYHHLLDKPEHGAVSHQFEIEQLGLSKTGISHHIISLLGSMTICCLLDYKVWQWISSLVCKCGKSLHNTLEKYNIVAKSMIPPKPSLAWEQVTNLEFLTLIKTLWGCDNIHTEDWTKQPFHDATRAWMKLQRAHDELTIIGTEAHWIIASIQDEEDQYVSAMSLLQHDCPGLVNHVSKTFHYQRNIHLHIHAKLAQLVQWAPYFSTFKKNVHPQPQELLDGLITTTTYHSPHSNDSVTGIDGSEDEADDDAQDERNQVVNNLVEVMVNLNVE